jgi:hypothetical protein
MFEGDTQPPGARGCMSIRFRPLQACQYSQQDKAARLHYARLDGL